MVLCLWILFIVSVRERIDGAMFVNSLHSFSELDGAMFVNSLHSFSEGGG